MKWFAKLISNPKKFPWLFASVYIAFVLIGIVVCIILDTQFFSSDYRFSITYGFLFTIPFTVIICVSSMFSFDFFLNRSSTQKSHRQLKIWIAVYFSVKGLLYIIPILVACLLYFFQNKNSIFNIFSVFAGIILLWVSNVSAQFILFKIDWHNLVSERERRKHVVTGDSFKPN